RFNDTRADYRGDQRIHQRFERQVSLTPNHIALVYGDEHLTYAELNARANQLAHYLRRYRTRAEMIAGICMDRSLGMVIGLLGILKAGGAYLPLDTAYPTERLAYMLEDAAPMIILTNDAAHGILAELSPAAPILNLDRDIDQWTNQPESDPDHAEFAHGA